MSVITGYGEKVLGVPSIDGDMDVPAPLPVSIVEGQVVVQGEKVHVTMAPPILRVETTIHDPTHKPGLVTIPGDAGPLPPVAKTRYMVVAPIHDGARRPDFVVNLGDVDYRPPLQRPWLGPAPISVGGGHKRYHVSADPELYYPLPAGIIHGFHHEEPKPKTSVIWEHPPITAKIHDFSRLISL